MQLKQGTLIVFEGLDGTGKTTQANRVARALHGTLVMHMPSGDSKLSDKIYRLTEQVREMDPMTRQLLHLACHSENMHAIHRSIEQKGLILDRWWWSTIAYGYFGGELDTRIPQQYFMTTLATVWSSLRADLVFMFDETYTEDANNNERVRTGYKSLMQSSEQAVRRVPRAEPEDVTAFIVEQIKEAGLAVGE